MTDSEMNKDHNAAMMHNNTEDQHTVVTLSTPMENQNHIVSVTQGLEIIADFDFGSVAVENAGRHLIFHFPDGGRITLENIHTLIENDQSPTLTLQDGSVVSADQILASILSPGDEVEPAAAESGQNSGGVSEYEDNPGTIIDGVDKLDGLDFTQAQGIDAPSADAFNGRSNDLSQLGDTTTDNPQPSIVINDVGLSNDSTPTITGNAETGSTVIIEVGGVTMATTADVNGHWSVTIPDGSPLPDGSFTITGTATNSQGNFATATGGLEIDTTIIADIKLDGNITADDVTAAIESNEDLAITGTVGGDVVDGDTVTVTVNGNAHTGQVSGGAFSILVPGRDFADDADQAIDASVTATDAAGNMATAIDIESYGDGAQITPPDITDGPTASITLNPDITTDDIINAAESETDVTITGTVDGDVFDGDTVTVTVNGNAYTGQVSGGAFSVDVPGSDLAADTDHTIDASVTTSDAAGNSVTATDSESYGVDIQIGASINLDTQITVDDVINATESDTDIAITGTVGGDVVDGDTVTLTVNGNTYTGQVAGGTFSIDVSGKDLTADADHTIDASVTTTDAAGNSVTATDSESYGVVLGFDTVEDFEDTRPGEPVEIDVLANDSGDALQLVTVSVDGGDSVGTAAIVDGKVLFQPSADLVHSPDTPDNVTLTYTVTDAYGNVETGQAHVQTGIFYDEADDAFDSFITDASTGDLLSASVDLTEGQGDANLSASMYPQSSTTFDIEITVDKSVVEPNIDTYFLQDLTGSFVDDLANMTTDADGNGLPTLEEMVQVFEGKSGHSSYGTGTFVDNANGDGGTAHRQFTHGINIADAGDGTDNAGALQTQYDGYVAGGGSDYPESQFYAIKEIAEAIIKANGGNEDLGISAGTTPEETFGFTAGSNPVVVLSTDAVSHGYLAEDTDRFGNDSNLSGIMEMYAYVQASGMQLVVLAADLYAGNAGAVTFWNDVLAGNVANVDSGWNYGGRDGGYSIYNANESYATGQSINGYVAELNTDSSNIVSALQKAVDNIEFKSPLSLVTDKGSNETDENSYANLTTGDFVENPDGTFTQIWTVDLEAPVGGADDPQIAFVVTDGDGNPIGETVNVSVTVADGGQITGTEYDDTLIGTDTLSDTMYGETGDDRMDGRDGDDTLDGGAGNDILVGGEGDDLMIGGLGDDMMEGAGGSDTFVFSAKGGEGHDTISDFDVAVDVIRLTDVLDAEGDSDIDINDLLEDGGQNISANVTGADVELTISHGSETTVVTLAGINAGHTFDGDTTLSDLINHGLQIDPM